VAAWVNVCFLMDTEGPCDDPDKPELNATWLRVGWFFLTWTGFRTNPRSRPFGYHRVRDHWLERWGGEMTLYGDEHCWHYHHPPESGVGNEWGLDWTRGAEYDQIVSRQILERTWFPACFRAGGTILDGVSSRWVDAWFPFDYSNRAPKSIDGLIDWSSGIDRWTIYHPDPEDFRRPGAGRRRMGRSLDRRSWVHELTQADVDAAFEQASAGHAAILSCFDHDSRDIAEGVEGYRAMVADASSRYPDVPWRYAGPVEAMRNVLDVPDPPQLELEGSVVGGDVFIRSSEPIFQSFPWLAVRDGESIRQVRDDVVRVDETSWRWTPERSIAWDELGVGASTDLGVSTVAVLRPDDAPGRYRLRQPLEESPTQPNSIWAYSKLFPELSIGRASGETPEMDSARQATELLAARLAPNARVLDVGSAAGHLRRSLAPLGFDYHGIDAEEHIVEIGRRYLARDGMPQSRLRALPLDGLPRGERYDAVVSLSTLLYFPDFHEPLEIMARAADRLVVVRSLFGERTMVRWLPDILLEPGYQDMRAYFNVFARDGVAEFLESLGFGVEWIEDRRRLEKFAGEPEVVGGIELPYEFLVAERVRPRPSERAILGERFREIARAWREEGAGGPPG
jgi:Methyltransferase domain